MRSGEEWGFHCFSVSPRPFLIAIPALFCGFFPLVFSFFLPFPRPNIPGFSFPSFCSLSGSLMGNAENVIMLNIDSCILKIKTEGK